MKMSRFRLRNSLLALSLSAVFALTACAPSASPAPSSLSEGVPAELAPFYEQAIAWKSCDSGFECARVDAPIDWANPAGKTLELSLIRHRASGSDRAGSLFVNPGGPGGSGVTFIRDNLDYAIDKKLQAAFDVIGFDPRGIGESTPVTCYDAPEMDEYLYGLTPTKRNTAAALSEQIAAATSFGKACLSRTGELLGHVDSVSVARDLDMLRALVGDKTLNYVGYSYGTFIGAMYAQTFPQNVGKLVLDGAVDPSVSSANGLVAQAKGFEMALGNYLTWCFKQLDCPFENSVATARATISTLLAQLDEQPIEAEDGRQLGADTMVTAIIAPLYSKNSWKYLTQLFDDVINRDGAETAFALADWYNDRNENGEYQSNQTEAYDAVTCLDSPASPSSQWQAEAAQLEKAAPLIGRYFAYSEANCSVWPIKAVLTPGPLGPTGERPIVVIGTTGDPATPIAWAESLAKQLTNGRLIRLTGEGHTGYNRGSECVNKIVDDYMLGIAQPATLSTCS